MKIKATIISLLAACGIAMAQSPSGSASIPLHLSLEDCRQMALSGSSASRGAEYDVLAARYRKEAALWEYFPRVSINALGFMSIDPLLELRVKDIFGDNRLSNSIQGLLDTYGPQYGFPSTFTMVDRGWHAGVTLAQPIFAGGRIINGNRLARLGVEAAELQRDVQNRNTRSDVDDWYWQVLDLQDQEETVEQFLRLMENINIDVSAAHAAGLASEDDLLQVRLNLNSLKSAQVQLRDGIRLAKMNLLNSIGQDYTVISANATADRPWIDDIVLEIPSDEALDPSGYYRNEEDIAASMEESRLLALNVEAQKLQKKMAMGEALPQIAVGGSYGYTDVIGDPGFNGLAFASVQIPITAWGKTAAEMKRLQTQVDKAAAEQEYLSSQLVLQVRQYWVELNSAWDQYQLAVDSKAAAEASYNRVLGKYNAGMATLSELLQAQTELRNASGELSSRLGDYRKALRRWCDLL